MQLEEGIRTDALDEVVRLLFQLDAQPEENDRLHDRICEAICRLTSMERAVLFLHDPVRHLVLPAGNHGVDSELLAHSYGTLEEVPIAQRALARDDVVESEDLAHDLPDRYGGLPTLNHLTCTPVTAAGRWLGVIFADRCGAEFSLTEEERRTMRALGRTAALATHVREATAQRERAIMLREKIGFARGVHDHVMQRLFGVSLALGAAESALGPEERARCSREVEAALTELREALTRSVEPVAESARVTLRAELDRLGRQYKQLPLQVEWESGSEVPEELEPLAVSVLAEALRNAERHAAPSEIKVRVRRAEGAIVLELKNDGLDDGPAEAGGKGPGSGIGLRLASYEAMQRGGVLEYGREGEEWRVRLVLPSSAPDGPEEPA